MADTVLNHWEVGAQIVVTSHTRVFNEGQERTISAIQPSTIPGYAEILLDAPILRPTTEVDYPDFAVEVALLSRNIVFDAVEGDPMGGHLEVRRTPFVQQMMDGVEIVNFGHPGVPGRYPIHTHFCRDMAGSVISRNSVRLSKQRCIVLHGTDGVLVQQNVAFDT